jgi:hypothetical protein
MSNIRNEVLESNRRYAASFGEKGKLGLPPARRFAILTCMDARLIRQVRGPCRKGTPRDSQRRRAAPALTPFALWSSATNCSAPRNFFFFFTPTAAWSSLPTE